jgi:hypothetical protein
MVKDTNKKFLVVCTKDVKVTVRYEVYAADMNGARFAVMEAISKVAQVEDRHANVCTGVIKTILDKITVESTSNICSVNEAE